jgi:hypothetical protein
VSPEDLDVTLNGLRRLASIDGDGIHAAPDNATA